MSKCRGNRIARDFVLGAHIVPCAIDGHTFPKDMAVPRFDAFELVGVLVDVFHLIGVKVGYPFLKSTDVGVFFEKKHPLQLVDDLNPLSWVLCYRTP